jgi:hypothetical protein
MNRSALPLTDMFIGQHVLIGMSMGTGCLCRNNAGLGGNDMANDAAAALLGTWRMTSWTRKAVMTGEVTDAMRSNPIGYIAYHADGRMMALVVSSHRPGSREHCRQTRRRLRYSIPCWPIPPRIPLKDDRVIHHVDAAWNPAWGISDLIRPYALDGDTLVISGAPGKDPTNGEEVIYRMEFRKV